MILPRYTVIIPMRHFQAEAPALAGLRHAPIAAGMVEILVAEGAHPAGQRNAALERARGEIIVFFDDDCRPSDDFWAELAAAFARPEVDIVGGPALLRPEATAVEKIFHALLTHTLIVGTVSARYASRGSFRPARQTELILCNLAVRKAIFTKIGPLSTRLYPNEENEWLDRAQAVGAGIFYDPGLRVFRPQRGTWREMGAMLLRYGMGRTRQFMVSGWHPTFHQFLPVMVLATFAVLIHWHLEIDFIVLWLIASAIIAATSDAGLSPASRIMAGLAAPLLPLTYTVGQILGWAALLNPSLGEQTEIVVRNECGEKVK